MRVAALYDVHGNVPALEAVLAEVEREGIDRIVSGGDVLWGPLQGECVGLLRAVGATFIAGNCERDVLAGGVGSVAWCRDRLTPEERETVASWPQSTELEVDGLGRVLFCHATPRSDVENLTARSSDDDIAAAMAGVAADVVVGGHTHVQLERSGAPRIVNAGSVGLPCQGAPGAYWALLGPDVELRRAQYDVEHAIVLSHEAGFPRADDCEDLLRGTVRAETATAYFDSRQRGT